MQTCARRVVVCVAFITHRTYSSRPAPWTITDGPERASNVVKAGAYHA